MLAVGLALAAAAVSADVKPVCVADRSKTPDQLGAALSYACSGGGVNCTDINPGGARYYPNNVYAHCDWAFDKYYQANPVPASCSFSGTAFLVNCSTACTKCQTNANATDTELTTDLDYLCGKGNILGDLCAAIHINGSAYQPNTLRDHANWAVNEYYQVYRCPQPQSSCDFNASAHIASC
eukprot:TRINITY_DN60015_c0_g1_i1.p1 TRINITY_DN60015_c0_g1~~TRINITY_DN60015_c0_g1_i1.p1  ORF type:complete len:208 (+),score=90.11 TRINITY_DN60015_c0_g1_i1:82-624(+)